MKSRRPHVVRLGGSAHDIQDAPVQHDPVRPANDPHPEPVPGAPRHLHRGSAVARGATCPAHVLRLRGCGLLHGADLPGEQLGLRPDQAAPARRDRRDEPNARLDDGRAARRDAGGARPDWPRRHAAPGWRDPGRARRREGRRAVHAFHHVDLFDRGRGREHGPAVLVSAQRHARPRVHGPADRPREGCGLLGARGLSRFAGPRAAPQGYPERPFDPPRSRRSATS